VSLFATDIRVERRRKRLLDGASIEVLPGHLTAVVGPNGAGKSTLLKVLAGEITPSAGRVSMNGTLLDTWSLKQRARTRAVLSQAVHVSSPLSALEVVLLARTPHNDGVETAEDLRLARAALGVVGCAGLADRSYATLSGGERQRVQLARAIAQIRGTVTEAPRYILLDEPTSALDLAHQHDCLTLVRSLLAERVGVLAILHDLNLAARYADSVVVIADGKVVAAGPPSAVLTADRIRDVFAIDTAVLPHPTLAIPLVVVDRPLTLSPLARR
jgi:iron complex transport system ATP-binding protein